MVWNGYRLDVVFNLSFIEDLLSLRTVSRANWSNVFVLIVGTRSKLFCKSKNKKRSPFFKVMNSLLGLHTSKLRFLYRSVLPQSQKRNASISKTKKCGLVGTSYLIHFRYPVYLILRSSKRWKELPI